MKLTVSAAFSAAAGVGLGAFGAHGLEGRLGPEAAGWWETATFYLLVHAVAAFATRPGYRGGWLLLAGAWVFSGTLYAMALGAPGILGAVTPVGGVLMIAGWVWLGASVLRKA